ncbi:MAG TPA: hypothetical protein DEQ61_09760 [Streptomyces sp.]|nr:hypothetical protein [Streptomyces sp.]
MTRTLFDADFAATSDLATHSRRTATVADADAAYRADLVTRYVTADSWEAELKILAEAVRYDKQHPDELPLYDEMHGTRIGQAA